MAKKSPILVRIFKEESELEVWKEDQSGRFVLLRTYPICRWSGELGPKIKQGDRQAPEGFYTITPALMNPNSSFYLAINMGFPNAYDRANGRSGAFLMIHGDCSSSGCYAMTDEQISEIYALARKSFFGGQRSFQIQAFPFRMTALNMAKHRNSPHLDFWKMLKQGYDHFEVTRLEPKVDVCERRYVFDAESSSRFSAADRCPAYKIPDDIVAAVRDKQRRDDTQTAEFISRGTPTVPARLGTDGGMNQTFLAAVRNHGGPGATIRTAAGTIPAHARPPGERSENVTGSTMSLASANRGPHRRPGLRCKLPRRTAPAASAASSATCSDPRAKTRAASSGVRKSGNPHPSRKLPQRWQPSRRGPHHRQRPSRNPSCSRQRARSPTRSRRRRARPLPMHRRRHHHSGRRPARRRKLSLRAPWVCSTAPHPRSRPEVSKAVSGRGGKRTTDDGRQTTGGIVTPRLSLRRFPNRQCRARARNPNPRRDRRSSTSGPGLSRPSVCDWTRDLYMDARDNP